MPIPNKKLLLVEDEAIIALEEARTLRSAGYAVEVVHNGEDAVAALEQDPDIALALMDIDLGAGLSGPEAAERMMKIRPLPIVFLTSHSERGMVEKVREITRYGYVIKNSGTFVLLSSIEMAFDLFEAQQRALHHARQSEAMLEALPDLVFAVGLDGIIQGFHAPAGAALAVPPDQIVGTDIRQIFPPEEVERHLALYRACRETGQVISLTYELNIDKQRRVFELRAARQDEDQVLAIVRDITERTRSEQLLRNATAQYEHLFERSPVATLIVDDEDTILKINSAFTRLFGYTTGETVGKKVNDLIVPEDRSVEGLRLTQAVTAGKSVFLETPRRRKDGSLVQVAITGAPMELDDHWVTYAIYQKI